MPTPLKCSNCGAPLSVPDGQRRVTCTYCGATSELQPEPAPRAPRTSAPQAAPPVTVVVNVPSGRPRPKEEGVSCFLVLAVVGAIAVAIGSSIAFVTGAGVLGDGLFEHMQWNGSKAPLLVDIDGDGDAEIVGLVRFWAEDETIAAVAAFDPEDGDRLWAARLDEEQDLYLASVGGRLWVADARGRLRSFEPATGTIVTNTSLGEKAEGFCGDGRGGLVVRLSGGGSRAVDTRTSAVSPLPDWEWGSACIGGFWASDPGATATTRLQVRLDHRAVEGLQLPAALGATLDVESLFTVEGGASYVLASRRPGTPVPLVVARDASGRVAWTLDVPAGDPLAAETGVPDTIGVGPGRVYVPWALKDGDTPNRVSAFDAATGARVWDATLPDDVGDVEAIVSDGTRVYVSTWTWLRVLDVSSGELLYTVGRW